MAVQCKVVHRSFSGFARGGVIFSHHSPWDQALKVTLLPKEKEVVLVRNRQRSYSKNEYQFG